MFRLLRYTLGACGPVLLVGSCLVAARLVPLHIHQGVAFTTLWPLAVPGLTTAFEAAMIIGLPLGYALASAGRRFRNDVESAGSSGWAQRRFWEAIVVSSMWFAVTVALVSLANLKLTMPGQVVSGMMQSSRHQCLQSHRAWIPLPALRVSWVCEPHSSPKLVAEQSKGGVTTKIVATRAEVSDDVSTVDLYDFGLSSFGRRGLGEVHVTAGTARLRGLWPWPKSQRLSGVSRAVFVAAVGSLLGLVVMYVSSRRCGPALWTKILWGSSAGLSAWLLLRLVDAHPNWISVSYACVPLGAVLALMLAWTIVEPIRIERWTAFFRPGSIGSRSTTERPPT